MKYLFIFDMGGVVVNECSLWPGVAQALGLGNNEKTRAAYFGLLQAASRGNISSMESLTLTAQRAHLSLPSENYWETLFHPVCNEQTVRLINILRTSGQRVVCGTNTIDVHYEYHMKKGEYSIFDKVYASNMIGQIKPDITFWHKIRDAEKKYEFSDMLFFDDLKENVDAAASLGIHACLFTGAAGAAEYIRTVTGMDLKNF
jgi:glucose-1-phosphatase